MKITSLRLQDFRSYTDRKFDFTADKVIFCGPNGAGKTNVLEALSVLSVGKSWREQTASDLIRRDTDSAQITTITSARNQISAQITPRSRRFTKNEKTLSRTKLIGQIPTLLFCPEYLHLLTGPKAPRVAFFDRFLVQLSPAYRPALQQALKAHKQKTALLRSIRAGERTEDAAVLLRPWNQILADTMPVITDIREQTLKTLAPWLQQAQAEIALHEEPFTVQLEKAVNVSMQTMDLQNWFEHNTEMEVAAGKNFIAPQRDDFVFFLRDQSLAATASRGETRTALLSLLQAQKHALSTQTGENPIWLLDDVFSELDDHRQAQLEALCADSQIFFTTTHREHFDRFTGEVQVFEMGPR